MRSKILYYTQDVMFQSGYYTGTEEKSLLVMASIQALVCCHRLVLVVAGVQGQAESDDWPCDHQVFCNPGEEGILHTVQMSGLFNDSKTFVDMPMNYDTETVQSNFDNPLISR